MIGARLIAALTAAGILASQAGAAPAFGPVPMPRSRPAVDVAKTNKDAALKDPKHRTRNGAPGSPPPAKNATNGGPPASPPPAYAAPPVPPPRPSPPLAITTTAATSTLDINAVRQALELVRKDRQDEATTAEKTISDPVARKIVEWAILRSDNAGMDFPRYAAFIAANPSWPSIVTLRRRAEAALWQQQTDPVTTINFFADAQPMTAKGYFALARAWLIRGDTGRALAAVRTAWHETGFSEDVEEQARQAFAGMITPDEDKGRMDARLYAEDYDAGIRAAHHLDAAQFAIAKARAAAGGKSANTKALLDAVPAAAQHDPGYIFSRIKWLRRNNDIKEAAQLLLAAPRDPARLVDPDQWWTERRLIARKLLDLGDAKLAYEIANGAAPPSTENHRAEQHFTAGWIALRFLHEPAVAMPHFARIADGVANPITLARAFYWQGRAAQALGREQEARAHYENAARYPTAYYGQLARAVLHINDLTLRDPPPPPAEHLELARVFEILYAIEERDLVAGMAADIADKTSDDGALAALAEITTHHNDARATLLIGKTAVSRGFPLERYAFPDFGVPSFQPIGPPVDRWVVLSIIRQESAFNPRVVSAAHALGLMQVTPSAGRNTAKKFKVAFDQNRLLSDLAYNLQLGAAELGDDIADYRGSYILAFASYNAGRHRVQEWITQYGDPRERNIDPIDWIERIPFSETRNYVQRVVENMQVYRARLDSNAKLLIEADLRRGGG